MSTSGKLTTTGSTGRAQSAGNTSAFLHQFRVHLQQVERLYDTGFHYDFPGWLSDFHTVVGLVKGKPEIVFQGYRLLNAEGTELTGRRGERWTDTKFHCFDATGTDLGEADREPIPRHEMMGSPYKKARQPDLLSCRIEHQDAPDNSSAFGRTFIRANSKPVANRWVYIFRSTDIDGKRDVCLQYELFYDDNGLFQRMDPAKLDQSRADWEQAHADGRTSKGSEWHESERPLNPNTSKESELSLDVEIIQNSGRRPAHYFFYLAPWQLPWAAIQELMGHLPSRTVRLLDTFYTDIFGTRNPQNVATLLPNERDPSHLAYQIPVLYATGELNYVLHLVDPFEEAQWRAHDHSMALQRLDKLLTPKNVSDKYILARSIELFTSSDPKLRGYVQEKLNAYLYEHGVDELARKQVILDLAAKQLISWLGYSHSRASPANWRHFISFEKGFPRESSPLDEAKMPVTPFAAMLLFAASFVPESAGLSEKQREPTSPFSDAVMCYLHAPEETRVKVIDAINTVTFPLTKTPRGQAWLRENLDKGLERLKRLAKGNVGRRLKDAGRAHAGLEFQLDLTALSRRFGKPISTALSITHTVYAAAWASRHPEFMETIRDLNHDWAKRMPNTAKVLEELGEKPLNQDPYPAVVNSVKALAKTAGFLRYALTFWYDLDQLYRDRKSFTKWLKATGSLANSVAAGADMAISIKVVLTQDKIATPAICRFAIYGHSVAVVTGLIALADSHEPATMLGRSLDLFGAVLALAVVSMSGGPVAIGLNIASTLLQAAGQYIASEYDNATLFLKCCEFGKGADALPLLGDKPQVNPYRDIGDRTSRYQLTALQKLMYGCRIELELVYTPSSQSSGARHGSRALYLTLKPYYWHCFTAGCNWTIDLGVRRKFTQNRRALPPPVLDADIKSPPLELEVDDRKAAFRIEVLPFDGDEQLFPGVIFQEISVKGMARLTAEVRGAVQTESEDYPIDLSRYISVQRAFDGIDDARILDFGPATR